MKVKQAAVAGQFYPEDGAILKQSVEQCVAHGFQSNCIPKAIVAPHAGYIYSGDIAGSAYSVLAKLSKQIKKVVLLGPCHRVPVRHFTIPTAQCFETPLGQTPIDQDTVKQLSTHQLIEYNDASFAEEHSLEVQLPFLQTYLDDFELIPIIVGAPTVEQSSALIEQLYGDQETLIVISSDLSHYLNYKQANDLDMQTSQQIVTLNYQAIGDQQACGRFPLKGLLHLAEKKGLTARAIDLRNSGDTQGDHNRVVGYGAYHFYEADEKNGFYSKEQKNILRDLVKQSILYGIEQQQVARPQLDKLPFDHQINKATFVTFEKNTQLRGCIGSLEAHQPLVIDLVNNAYKAAFQDPRFSPVVQEELSELKFFISILSDPEPIQFNSEAELIAQLRKTIDGLIIADQGARAIFLPSVWESIHEPELFLKHLKVKAGLGETHWSESFKAYRFIADVI